MKETLGHSDEELNHFRDYKLKLAKEAARTYATRSPKKGRPHTA